MTYFIVYCNQGMAEHLCKHIYDKIFQKNIKTVTLSFFLYYFRAKLFLIVLLSEIQAVVLQINNSYLMGTAMSCRAATNLIRTCGKHCYAVEKSRRLVYVCRGWWRYCVSLCSVCVCVWITQWGIQERSPAVLVHQHAELRNAVSLPACPRS